MVNELYQDPSRPPRPPLAPPTGPPGSALATSPPTFSSRPDPRGDLPPLPRPAPSPEPDRDRRLSNGVVIALVAAVAASLLTAGVVVLLVRNTGGSSARAPVATQPGAKSSGLDIQALVKKAQPSVVSIETGQQTTSGQTGAAGSGVILSAKGLVLTNAHVVAGASTMSVVLSDGKTEPADLVGSLPDNDVALIQIRNVSGLTPADLGDSDTTQVGDSVVAIGNALNLGGLPSVTEGIISAKDRTISGGGASLDHLLQTDAAINPGNSGGPLLDASGEVIGLNTAIAGNAQNIGFAIAINSVKPLIKQIQGGQGQITPDSPTLGVATQDVSGLTPDVIAKYGIVTSDGALITSIETHSSATAAGLQVGDVITAIDSQAVNSSDDAAAAVQAHTAGDQITITFERQGQIHNVQVTLLSRRDTGH
jgi:S1-C subfamily serine protease